MLGHFIDFSIPKIFNMLDFIFCQLCLTISIPPLTALSPSFMKICDCIHYIYHLCSALYQAMTDEQGQKHYLYCITLSE